MRIIVPALGEHGSCGGAHAAALVRVSNLRSTRAEQVAASSIRYRRGRLQCRTVTRPDALSRALVDAAFELHGRRLRQSTDSDALLLVRVPDEPHPLAATIIGHSGADYGIVVAAGAGAWLSMLRFVTEAGDRLTDSAESTILAITIDPPGQLPPPFRALLD